MALGGGPPPIVYATWNPADIGSGLSLSGSDLIVTRSGSGWSAVRATQGKTAGKWYFELYRYAGPDKAQSIYGSMNPADSLTNYPGNPGVFGASIGFQALNVDDVNVYQNGFVGTFSGQADVPIGGGFAYAVDVTTGSIWVKALGAATWIGGGDPVAGTTPTRTFTAGTSFFPAVGINQATCAAQANFGASAFIETPPTGFSPGWYT